MTIDADALRSTLATELGSDFELGEIIGRGGFAVVFRTRDLTLHRDVAVKVLSPEVALDPTAEERFRREARVIASLEHPNIVPVFRAGVAGKVLYIVMRLVDGRSLARVLDERGSLPWADATRLTIQAADALAYAHGRGIIHRDIKPDNLLLDAAGNVLVSDFGIARFVADQSPLTVRGTVSGTSRYMSPEQALGEVVDARSDVYSLGIVLHQMLTGRVPFDGGSPAATLKQQLTVPIPAIAAPNVPPRLRAILARALASSAEDRFANGGELRDALADLRSSVLTPSARRRVSALIVGGVVLSAVLTTGFYLWRSASKDALARRRPAIDAIGDLPDSLLQQLRTLHAVDSSEAVRYVFAPAGATVGDAFVLTDKRLVRITPRGVRSYLLPAVRGISMNRMNGLGAVVLWIGPGQGGSITPDTLFVGLGDQERTQLYEKLRVFNFAK